MYVESNHYKGAIMLNQPDLTLQETCALIKCTAPTIYRLIERGELKSYKVGRVRRITFESVATLRNGTKYRK